MCIGTVAKNFNSEEEGGALIQLATSVKTNFLSEARSMLILLRTVFFLVLYFFISGIPKLINKHDYTLYTSNCYYVKHSII